MPSTFRPDVGYVLQYTIKDQADAVVDLTDITTITLEGKNRAGTVFTLTGASSAPTLGYVEFTVTSSLFTSADTYDCQIHLGKTGYTQHTEIFPLEVIEIVGTT